MTAFPVVNCILCRCHGEIGDIVSFNRLQRQLAGDDRVASVEICDALCLGDILANLARRMQADNGTRLLIAGCSPLARGEDLIDRLEADGVDPARVMVTDIREGCAWIHAAQSEAATAKAADLIRMGITALRYREAPPDIDIAVCQRVLVMGGGPAGLAAAAALGRAGVAVTLVEATGRLGGMLNYLGWVAPTNQGADAMREPLVEAIENDPHIQVHLGTRVAELSGSAGNFEARLSGKNGETHLTAGAVIVATGAKPRLSRGIYRYGELPGVISGMEMEKAFRDGGPIGGRHGFHPVRERPQPGALLLFGGLLSGGPQKRHPFEGDRSRNGGDHSAPGHHESRPPAGGPVPPGHGCRGAVHPLRSAGSAPHRRPRQGKRA